MHRPIRLSATVGVQYIGITDVLQHDTSFLVCLFPVALFVQKSKKWGLGLVLKLAACCCGISATSFKDVIDFLCFECR